MYSLYGNSSLSVPRTTYNFAAVYPSRKDLEDADNEDSIGNNSFVLIDYTLDPEIDGMGNNYERNYNKDIQDGNSFAPSNYHLTVWQKILNYDGDRNYRYIAIARLNSVLPTFETWGFYNLDILKPLSDSLNLFGAGKQWHAPNKSL